MFMVTGEWLGYTSSQDHIVHREYVTKKTAGDIRTIGDCIIFTDGTRLRLTITEVRRRKLPNLNGYGDLIRRCIAEGTNEVAKLKP